MNTASVSNNTVESTNQPTLDCPYCGREQAEYLPDRRGAGEIVRIKCESCGRVFSAGYDIVYRTLTIAGE